MDHRGPLPDRAAPRSAAAGGRAAPPARGVTPQGALLELLARAAGARTILEIGTLGGYRTSWLARALPPGGRLVTLEALAREPRVRATAIQTVGGKGYDGFAVAVVDLG